MKICDYGHCSDDWFVGEAEVVQACGRRDLLDLGLTHDEIEFLLSWGRSRASVNLASKGVHAEAESSNAAYYIAGASVLSAAAVAYVITSKKGQKTVEQPLIAHDDEFKAFM